MNIIPTFKDKNFYVYVAGIENRKPQFEFSMEFGFVEKKIHSPNAHQYDRHFDEIFWFVCLCMFGMRELRCLV